MNHPVDSRGVVPPNAPTVRSDVSPGITASRVRHPIRHSGVRSPSRVRALTVARLARISAAMHRGPRWSTILLTMLVVGTALARGSGQTLALTGAGNPECDLQGANSYQSNACYGLATHYGVRARFQNVEFTLPSSEGDAGHVVKHGVWAFSGSPCGASFVDQGWNLRKNFGSTHHFYYHASLNSIDGYTWVEINLDEGIGPFHTYETRFESWDSNFQGTYSLWRSGIEYGLARHQGVGSCQSRVGAASDLLPSGVYSIPTVDATLLAYCTANPCGTPAWADWNASTYWIDYPCGLGQNPPNCFNGQYIGGTTWSSNKP